ncbi:hypothetical protein ACHHYP_05137 [Achlya hypogyna]|uniref:Uncharacterized protein n=1 Tax=Achlya hypogyna TaxID=1202772 RepID=A0A1V9YYZ5_ACHHY|nr:hypothetical protein ACHHYP_05137 [Achlya hypogyna]
MQRSTSSSEADVGHDVEDLTRLAVQQRQKIIEDLVQLRRNDFAYLKALHMDPRQSYFLNVALLNESQLNLTSVLLPDSLTRRCHQLYYLGLSLGKLLESPNSAHLAIEGCQLMEELDFYFLPTTMQNMKLVVAPKSTLYERPADPIGTKDVTEPQRAVLSKWNQKPVYRRLLTPHISFPLDYCQLLVSVCEVLPLVYAKLLEDACSHNPFVFQSALRFDEKVKKLVLDAPSKQLATISADIIKTELAGLRGHKQM